MLFWWPNYISEHLELQALAHWEQKQDFVHRDVVFKSNDPFCFQMEALLHVEYFLDSMELLNP